jgi:hypothetical protein
MPVLLVNGTGFSLAAVNFQLIETFFVFMESKAHHRHHKSPHAEPIQFKADSQNCLRNSKTQFLLGIRTSLRWSQYLPPFMKK